MEAAIEHHPNTLIILKNLKRSDYDLIENVDDIFNRVKKPYLQKRTNLNLFIAEKRGELVKEAPNAYGVAGEKHYYFIHAYNCIYECEYCYLQGYFNSPDIVLFVNHDAIINEMARLANAAAPHPIWFHAGEFSDSLALNKITNEYEAYWQFFKQTPNAFLELRTKSATISTIKTYEPLKNVVVSFSLSPEKVVKQFDLKTASYKARLKSIQTLGLLGFRIGLHLDPIIANNQLEEQYEQLAVDITTHLRIEQIEYISVGVVRFTKDVYYEVQKNYPNSPLLAADFIKSFDNKIRYARPQRQWILNTVKQLLEKQNIPSERIYFCME